MSQFRTFNAGTARSLRVIAEEKSAPDNFPEDLAYHTQAGAPVGRDGGVYKDTSVMSMGDAKQTAPIVPFTNLRG
jgi:hypothetical protein